MSGYTALMSPPTSTAPPSQLVLSTRSTTDGSLISLTNTSQVSQSANVVQSQKDDLKRGSLIYYLVVILVPIGAAILLVLPIALICVCAVKCRTKRRKEREAKAKAALSSVVLETIWPETKTADGQVEQVAETAIIWFPVETREEFNIETVD